jgi:hypothetical protein
VSFERYRELAPDHQPEVDIQRAIAGLKDGLERIDFAGPEFRSSPLIRLVVLEDLRARGLVNDRLEWTTHVDSYAGAHSR